MLTLVEDGSSRAAVVISPRATDTERFAARELARYVHVASGAVMPVFMGRPEALGSPVVYVGTLDTWADVVAGTDEGDSAKPAPGDVLQHPQSFLIRASTPDELYLIGSQPVGALWAVYELVSEHFGVGFVGMGRAGDEVPVATTLVLPEIDVVEEPVCRRRGLTALGNEDDAPAESQLVSPLLTDRIDWMAKHRFNRLLIHSGRFDVGDVERHVVPEAKVRGIEIEWTHHNLGHWMPSDVYGREHPEYYAVRNALRQHDRVPQLCLCTSNDAVVDELAQNILAFWDDHGWVDVVGLWPNDGYGMCECDECAAMDQYDEAENRESAYFAGTEEPIPVTTIDRNKTNRYVRLLNRVAELVVAKRPDARIGGLFYVDMLRPSVDYELHPAVRPSIALYWRCSAHAIDDPNCPTNRYFARVIDEWDEAAPGMATIYEYYMGMGEYCSLPFPIEEAMRADWRTFTNKSIAGGAVQSGGSHHVAYAWNYAAFAALAWNPQVDMEHLTDRWYRASYGPAADAVRSWWQALADQLQDIAAGEGEETYEPRRPNCYLPSRLNFPSLWDQELTARLGVSLDLAREFEGLSHGQTHRLNQMRTYHTYCVASAEAIGRERLARDADEPLSDAARVEIVDSLERIEAFVNQISDPTILWKSQVLKRLAQIKSAHEG